MCFGDLEFPLPITLEEDLGFPCHERVYGHIFDAGDVPDQPDDGMFELWRHTADGGLVSALPDFIGEGMQARIRHLRVVDHRMLAQE